MNLIINTLIPIFAFILAGYLFVRFAWLPANTADVIVNFVYKVAAPALIFIRLSTAKISHIFHWHFILASILSTSTCYILAFFLIKKYHASHNSALAALAAYAISLGNAAFIALPILLLLMGNTGVILAITSVMLVVVLLIPVVIHFISDPKTDKQLPFWKKTYTKINSIMLNPLVLSSIFGIVYSATRLPMPTILHSFFSTIGETLTPLALIAVGMSFTWSSVVKNWRLLSFMAIFKMFICPLVAFLFALLFHLQPNEMLALVLIAAVPSPKTAYILAKQFKLEPELMASNIALTSLVAFFTLFGLLTYVTLAHPDMLIHHTNHEVSSVIK